MPDDTKSAAIPVTIKSITVTRSATVPSMDYGSSVYSLTVAGECEIPIDASADTISETLENAINFMGTQLTSDIGASIASQLDISGVVESVARKRPATFEEARTMLANGSRMFIWLWLNIPATGRMVVDRVMQRTAELQLEHASDEIAKTTSKGGKPRVN